LEKELAIGILLMATGSPVDKDLETAVVVQDYTV